ncbi:hypothetical protein [uncultured Pseudacidovorax sp.]|uniref:hypothetical protein n=1 Tax=uncultured Pseudacidovorax sp. TaxID=679313 RepID=UPI0025DA1B1D|nr:hypothetical protein [uncultured Pseudacidovorax sp.]
MHETDWNTPRNGDFVRYVEQLTADSLQRVQSRAHAAGPAAPDKSAAPAERPRAASSPGAVDKSESQRPSATVGWTVAGLVVLGMLAAAGVPAGLLVLLAGAGLWLFKRFGRTSAAGAAARQMLGRLQQGLQNAQPTLPAAGTAARRPPRKKTFP